MQNDLSRRTFMGRIANTAAGVAVVSLDLTACSVDKAKSRVVPVAVAPAPTPTPTPATTSTVFKPMKLGAGGFVTGIDVSVDGSTKVVRCDTYGAYRWDAGSATWLPLLTATTMPVGDVGPDTKLVGAQGIFEVAVAPRSPNVIFMVFNGLVYRSDNGGKNFVRTAFAQQTLDSNDGYRTNGRKIAVDSSDSRVVFLGTQKSGLYRSLDNGASWSNNNGVPAGTTTAGIIVAIDHSSALVAGRRAIVYAHSAGNGVYRSSDGGDTFVALAGSPKDAQKMVVGPDGTVFIADNTQYCYRYRGGTWTQSQIHNGGNFHTVAVNPSDKNHVVVGHSGGPLKVSFDGGNSWLGTLVQTRAATDIPWLAWTEEAWMSSGDITFDPTNPGSLLFAQGIGVWTTNNLNGVSANWTSNSRGIEQLCTSFILSSPGNDPLFFVWDRGVFSVSDLAKFPTTHGPSRANSITHGWQGDYAPNNGQFIAAVINANDNDNSGYSLDGGKTWAKFATIPSEVLSGNKIGGGIAVGSTDCMVWVTSNNGSAWSTQNRGASWTRVDLPGVPADQSGFGWAFYMNRRVVAADRVNANTFYLYNYLPNVGGVFRSTDGGRSWQRVFAGPLSTWSTFNAKMRAVPGRAGHLFFAEGPLEGDNPADSPFLHSTDGGTTWKRISNVNEVYGFGFGKASSTTGYPGIFIVGYVDKKFGVHVSYDEGASWKFLTQYAADSVDAVACVEGDMNVYGRVYVGFGGSGAAYGDLVTA